MRMTSVVLPLSLSCVGAAYALPPISLPLTAAQVTCEEQQSGRLIHRLSVAYNGSSLFLWRSSPQGGVYRGLVSTNDMHFTTVQGDRFRQEQQLAFDLILRRSEDFLDPQRLPLPQATFVRRDTASNLNLPIDGFGNLLIKMDLAPQVPNPDRPTIPVQISTRTDRGEASADGAGRGLLVDDLLSPCHGVVTEFDLRVFAILARTVRPTACLAHVFVNPLGCAGTRFKTVIFRGAEPFTYRVDIFLYSAFCDEDGTCGYGEARIPILFRFVTNSAGRLVGGRMEALPFCEVGGQLDCIDLLNPGISVYALPPLRPGVEVQGEPVFNRSSRLDIDFIGSADNRLEDDVNWADLLRDTAWNGGLVP